jgi:hypothetical protein
MVQRRKREGGEMYRCVRDRKVSVGCRWCTVGLEV